MRKSIERAKGYGGTLIGGKGFPTDTDSVVVRGGKVISTKSLESLDKLIDEIGKSDDASFEAIQVLAAAPVDEAKTLVSKHAKRLQALAKGNSPAARLAAVRALAKRHDFADVPTLIYALSDPDPATVLEARDGLRRISRKFDGFGLPDYPLDEGEAAVEDWRIQQRAAVAEWKKWYLAVQPDAKFEE
jgi:hypothetical protein